MTEISPANNPATADYIAGQQASGALPQSAMIAGTLALVESDFGPGMTLGPLKLHLHDHALPDFDQFVRQVRAGHAQGRAVAVHCTTEAELVFAIAAIEEAGRREGDRIEHAGIAPNHLVHAIARLGLHVVTQPHFIAQRGDRYLADVPPSDYAALYRLAAFRRQGVTLAAGSDAPYGTIDPWLAMRAAATRMTASGMVIGDDEALSPEEALSLYLALPSDLTAQRLLDVGAPADLCLLRRPWSEVRQRLSSDDVRHTIIAGRIVH